jgi:hypothetical protein
VSGFGFGNSFLPHFFKSKIKLDKEMVSALILNGKTTDVMALDYACDFHFRF